MSSTNSSFDDEHDDDDDDEHGGDDDVNDNDNAGHAFDNHKHEHYCSLMYVQTVTDTVSVTVSLVILVHFCQKQTN